MNLDKAGQRSSAEIKAVAKEVCDRAACKRGIQPRTATGAPEDVDDYLKLRVLLFYSGKLT